MNAISPQNEQTGEVGLAIRLAVVGSFCAAYLMCGSILYFDANGMLGKELDLSALELGEPPPLLCVEMDDAGLRIIDLDLTEDPSMRGGRVVFPNLEAPDEGVEEFVEPIDCEAPRPLADESDTLLVEAASHSLHESP